MNTMSDKMWDAFEEGAFPNIEGEIRHNKQDERLLENECRRIARRHGWAAWKNEKNGNKGIPDSSFLHPDGRFYLIEFKRDAHQKPRPEQVTWAARFPQNVHLISDLQTFCALLNITEK